jgi:hypothetical protein
MSQKPTPEIAILTLDAEEIGNVLVRLGLLSDQLWHKTARDTLAPYCNHPEDLTPEAQFVYDLLSRPTPEIIDRWYGGEAGAMNLAARMFGRLFEDDESGAA